MLTGCLQTGLEASIYAFEGSYLSDALLPASSTSSTGAAQFGNIIKGCEFAFGPSLTSQRLLRACLG